MPVVGDSMKARNLLLNASGSGTSTGSEVKSQWRNPSDILSLLLLVGGDVIQRAIAQLAGDPYLPTPVVFSFGWVAYAFTTLLSAVGDNKLMPSAPDLSCIVVDVQYGHARTNQSWILGRVLRDYESYWMPDPVRKDLDRMLQKAGSPKAGLCPSVFDADASKEAGRPSKDFLCVAGFLVAITQLTIAAIPWILWHEWEIFAITAAGTFLAFVSASLPQWRLERYACRRNSNATIVLTQGNGAQHALVINGKGHGLNLEDLAGATGGLGVSKSTRPAVIILSVLWVGLLITVSGIQSHTWFLVAVGALGMMYTVVAAGAPRRPESFGIPLTYRGAFMETRTMEALKSVEHSLPGVGQSMVKIFFPGELRKTEKDWWGEAKKRVKKC